MADKKMTQVQALEIAVELMNEFAALDEQVEAREILEGMIEKKRAPRSRKPNADAMAFRDELVLVLEDLEMPITNAELTEIMNAGSEIEIKPQKVANNIRVLEKEGAVVRIRSEKPSGKDTFVLVNKVEN